MIEGNILVVAGASNTLDIFEIAPNHDLTFLSNIFLGNNGTIKDFYPIRGTNTFLIADGEN
ncbi:MAG: hypothetical protein ACXAC7_16740 [Candidatus Hodarchaeales archaeon]